MRPGLERYQKHFIANMMLAESNCTNAIDPDKKKKYRLQQPQRTQLACQWSLLVVFFILAGVQLIEWKPLS